MSNPKESIEGDQNPSQNISFEELLAQRTARFSQPEEEPETEETEPETEETEEEEQSEPEQTEETEEETEESEESEEEEEPEIDILSLTTEQIQDLAKRGKSRLLQRIGELTAQKHALEEKLTAQPEAKPFQSTVPAEQNPFRELKTQEEVTAKYSELEKVAEETDRILEDHEDYAADDVITLGDKEFTKKEIRIANRNARNAMLKFLPAQAAQIQRIEQLKGMEQHFNAAIPKEVPEVEDADSPVAKAYNAMIADPLVEQVRQRVPEIAPQLAYLLAHAAKSINSKTTPKLNKPATGIPASAKVPAVPVGAGAARSGGKTVKRKAEEAYQQFEQTGSEEAWIAARIARKS